MLSYNLGTLPKSGGHGDGVSAKNHNFVSVVFPSTASVQAVGGNAETILAVPFQ